VTRRAGNVAKLKAAADAAVVADAWISAAHRHDAFVEQSGGMNDERVYAALSRHPRVRRRLPNRVAPLAQLFSAYPRLGRWLDSPDQFHRFIRFTGAAAAGGGMARLVRRHELEALVDGLGEDVWRFGVTHGDASFLLPQDPSAAVLSIEQQGLATVYGFLADQSPEAISGLAGDVFDAAELPRPDIPDGLSAQAIEASVKATLEHADP
jgi:hypothetical protein